MRDYRKLYEYATCSPSLLRETNTTKQINKARVGTKAIHTDLGSQPVSLYKRPTASLTRLWATSALGALTAAAAVTAVRRLRRRPHKETVR